MKKKICMFLAGLSLVLGINAFAEDNDIKVFVEGYEVVFDVAPRVINDRTMVPMRAIFEKLGADVNWFEASETIIATKGSKIMALEIGGKILAVTDLLTGETKNIELEAPPVVIDDRTLVPARAVSESLDMDVEWDEATQTVTINKKAE